MPPGRFYHNQPPASLTRLHRGGRPLTGLSHHTAGSGTVGNIVFSSWYRVAPSQSRSTSRRRTERHSGSRLCHLREKLPLTPNVARSSNCASRSADRRHPKHLYAYIRFGSDYVSLRFSVWAKCNGFDLVAY